MEEGELDFANTEPELALSEVHVLEKGVEEKLGLKKDVMLGSGRITHGHWWGGSGRVEQGGQRGEAPGSWAAGVGLGRSKRGSQRMSPCWLDRFLILTKREGSRTLPWGSHEVRVHRGLGSLQFEAVQPARVRGCLSHCPPGARTGVSVVRPLCTLER